MDNEAHTLGNLQRITDRAFRSVLPKMGFSFRKEQAEYAQSVAEMLVLGRGKATRNRIGQSGVGLIEAGTGVGKTLGYLIPAAIYSSITQRRVGVSTNTLSLQDQIWGEAARRAGRIPDWSHPDDKRSDLAITLEVLNRLNLQGITVGFIRARRAYVDISRAVALIQDVFTDHPSLKRSADWISFKHWIDDVRNDEPGVSGLIKDAYVIPTGVSASDIWIQDNRDYSIHQNPFYSRARHGSRNAQLVFHTHAMALVNARYWHKILEEDDPISVSIFDEADQIESMGEALSTRRMRPRSLKLEMERSLKRNDNDWSTSARHAAHEVIEACRKAMDFMEDTREHYFDHESDDDDKSRIITYPFGLNTDRAEKTLHAIESIAQAVDRFNNKTGGAYPYLAGDWKQATQAFGEGTTVETICALSYTPVHQWASFQVRDMYPARLIGRAWARSNGPKGENSEPLEAHHDAIIFTSATMTDNSRADQFSLFRITLGLVTGKYRNLGEHQIEPRNYGNLNGLYLPAPIKQGKFAPWPQVFIKTNEFDQDSDLPEMSPNARLNPDWLTYVAQSLLLVHQSAQNQQSAALVLCSSYKEVEQLYQQMDKLGISINAYWHLERGYDKLGELMNKVRAAPSGQLLITPAAWQGISLRSVTGGQVIKDVVITRSPYPPFDPVRLLGHTKRNQVLASMGITQIKSESTLEAYERIRNRYIAYSKVRQGVGRLIRDKKDTGNLWILDPRVAALTEDHRLSFLTEDPALKKIKRRGSGVNDPRYWLVRAIPRRFKLREHTYLLMPDKSGGMMVYTPDLLSANQLLF